MLAATVFFLKRSQVVLKLTLSLMLLVLTACMDIPYTPEATNTLKGVVEVGYPVVGAKVTAFKWKKLKRGEEIGTTSTDADGKFQITYVSQYAGPVLLVASGGDFLDQVSLTRVRFEAGEELMGAISQAASETTVNINTWTTFAVARAEGTRETFGSDELAISKNFGIVSSHLRNESYPVAISTSRSGNIFMDKMSPDGDDLVLALGHAGLSQIAADNIITMPRLMSVLKADISDGFWDGKEKEDRLFFDKNQTKRIDSYTTRLTLVNAIEKFLKTAEANKTMTMLIDQTSLAQEAHLFDSLCFDSREALYPASEPALTFRRKPDVVPPPEEPTEDPKSPTGLPVDVRSFALTIKLNSEAHIFKDDFEDFAFSRRNSSKILSAGLNAPSALGYVVAHAEIENPSEAILFIKPNSLGTPVVDYEALPTYYLTGYGNEGFVDYAYDLSSSSEHEYLAFRESRISLRAFRMSDKSEIAVVDGFVRLEPRSKVLLKWYFSPPVTVVQLTEPGYLPRNGECNVLKTDIPKGQLSNGWRPAGSRSVFIDGASTRFNCQRYLDNKRDDERKFYTIKKVTFRFDRQEEPGERDLFRRLDILIPSTPSYVLRDSEFHEALRTFDAIQPFTAETRVLEFHAKRYPR